jgi:hypothetical protein
MLASRIDHVSLVTLSAIGYLVSYVASYAVSCSSVYNMNKASEKERIVWNSVLNKVIQKYIGIKHIDRL